MPDSDFDNDDPRLAKLHAWLTRTLGRDDYHLVPASADASFRRYFRVHHAGNNPVSGSGRSSGNSLIVMDAPPTQEDSAPFVKIAGLLADAGVHVPQIHAQDLEKGFLLLSDLGAQTYLEVLTADNADALFNDAIDALLSWQAVSRPGVLPDYDAAELRRELELFPDWYLQRHLCLTLDDDQHQALRGVFDVIVDRALAQPRVFVHRDYMPRNLMISQPNPGVLDFQDARYGPVAYDILSLFKDAFISWPQTRITAWQKLYWQRARSRNIPVPSDFSRFQDDLDWIGVQRHLKVLGIFARISHRDGKPHYLRDAPRFIEYLRPVIARHTGMQPLTKIFGRLP